MDSRESTERTLLAGTFLFRDAPREAAYAVSYVGPDVVIPTHYPTGSTAPAEFRAHMKTLAPQVIIKEDMEKPFYFIPARIEDAT